MTIEELKSLMCIPVNASKESVAQIFKRIAEVLKNDCVIKFQDNKYRILDFEFYYYSKNHQDISVHPRNSEALCWYINDFGGIDLNFESKVNMVFVENGKKKSYKYKLTDDSYFGGILIRQIMRLSDNMVYDGPWKVADLFRLFDATSHKQNNPIIIMEKKKLPPIGFRQPEKRHNLLGSKKDPKAKADYNIQECFTDVSDALRLTLETELAAFADCPYRYFYKS